MVNTKHQTIAFINIMLLTNNAHALGGELEFFLLLSIPIMQIIMLFNIIGLPKNFSYLKLKWLLAYILSASIPFIIYYMIQHDLGVVVGIIAIIPSFIIWLLYARNKKKI